MKKYILGLLGLALLGGSTLLGQAPQVGPKGEALPPPVKETPAPAACCQGGCCPKTKTVCSPEHYIKEKTKVVHTSGCETKCLPYFHGLFHHCADCDHGHCGHAIKVKYLVKKVQVSQHDAVKCNPVEVPACGHGRGHCAGGACALPGAAPEAVVQTAQPATPARPVIMPVSNK
jgi:hypothetical protein